MCTIADSGEVLDARPSSAGCGKGACSGACSKFKALARAPEAPETPVNLPIAVEDAFAAEILKPYRKSATYLQSAEIVQFCDKAEIVAGSADQKLVTGRGKFSIPESCYIDDTGHFNAVEFNICYNQLAYVLFAKCIEQGLIHRMRTSDINVISLPEFKKHQLPAMVIVSLESRYYKQLNSMSFTGDLTVNKITPVGTAWFFFTTITFADHEGVKAKGSVVLAFDPSYAPVKH